MCRLRLLALIALSSNLTFAHSPPQVPGVIYGNDDRTEIVDTSDNLMIEKAKSIAGMFLSSNLSLQTNGTYKVNGKTLIQRGWCSSERFATQTTSPVCTGFLVGTDVMATAGHCVSTSTDCKNYSWAFDYRLAKNTDTNSNIPKNSVYKCKAIIKSVNSSTTSTDYALIRLDRAVTDRLPLEYRKAGKVADGAQLVLIGHPKGLPMKLAAGAHVRSNSATNFFSANTDSYAGNSGSPVLDATTGIVEGILVRGESDSVTTSAGCSISNVCTDTSCSGEDATRTTILPAF